MKFSHSNSRSGKSQTGFLFILLFVAASFAPKDKASLTPSDTPKTQIKTQQVQSTDSTLQQKDNLQIDTAVNRSPVQTIVPADTSAKLDTTAIESISEKTLTNTKLFIYIILSILGLALFFYIFVMSLFKTFHRKKSTRQSLLLSWNLFFIVAIIWIFIIWGLVAGFWTSASFTVVVIFLFIISLIMTIIAVKSK